MARVPIACSLPAEGTASRMEEWQDFLGGRVVEVVRRGPTARLRLKAGDNVVLAAVDLARREKECCPFFEFRLLLWPDAVWLEIEAPEEAGALLDGLTRRPPMTTR